MSRHYFKTEYSGKPVDVLMGFDRPLNGFFMVIDYVEEPEDEEDDGYIFSNLWQDDPHPKTLRPYLDKLAELKISVPAQMIDEIEADGRLKTGNKDVRHSLVNSTYRRIFIG
ncbi:MAG: hypothetical protein B0W54_08030 [Cellvibrio sp. 79]|nr:MAG: hypothetical protein B0W54_08030 [Cellvibrio sp. 79]